MMAFSFSDIPWWGWLLLVVAAAIVGPIKVRILKSMLNANKEKPAAEE